MLEAEAMDSEEEADDASRNIKEQTSIGEPHSSRGEMPLISNSGALVDNKNSILQKDILAAKPFDPSVDNQLVSSPYKVNRSGKSTDICDMKSKVKAFGHPEGRSAEQFPENHGMGIINKQENTTDNSSPAYPSNSLMGMTSCKEDMKLSPLSHSRKAIEEVVSCEEQFNNLCTSHEEKLEDENFKRDANNSFGESKKYNTKKCIKDSLHSPMMSLATPNVEGQTHTYSQKRKPSVAMIGSKSMKSDHISRTSGSLNAPITIISEELDSLKSQQREPENIPTLSETGGSIHHIVENNDSFSLMQKFSASSTCSPNLTHTVSRTCKQSLSTSTMPGQSESLTALQGRIDIGLTCSDDFEGNALIHSSGKKHAPFSKSSSLRYKRKSLKHRSSASVANNDNNNKDPSSVGTVSGAGSMSGITSPKAIVLSDCPQNNVTGTAMNISPENVSNLCMLPLAGDGRNENEVSIGVRVLQASLKSTKKSETSVKSQKFDGISIKAKLDIHAEAPEKHEKPDKIEKVIPHALMDTNLKSSVSTGIPGSFKENEGSVLCISKVLVSRNTGCRSKARQDSSFKIKTSSDSLRRFKFEKKAIKSGNYMGELGKEDRLEEKVGKEDPPMENTRWEQYHPPEHNYQVIQDEKCLDPEEENKDGCNFSVKEDEGCGNKMKNKRKSFLITKSSSKDNISSLPKQNCPSAVRPEPMCFILSGKHDQRKEFQLIISRLRGRICKSSHNWSYKATHFIVPDSVRRTEKFFAAAAAGRWILRSDYLTASSEAGKFLDEEAFEWHRNGLTEDGSISLEAPRKWRTLKQRTGYGAFYGMHIVIYGECIAPSRDTLKRVVKAGGGTILATSPPYTRFLKSGIDFAVVSASLSHVDIWVQEFLRHEIPCVLSDYLVEYVCKPGYSLEKHVLYKTHAWADKSLANLLTRVSNEGSNEDSSDDLVCSVCGSRDGAEVMLICGDEAGTLGCGVGTHINCCDPPLAAVPEEDWFCSGCCNRSSAQKTSNRRTRAKPKKGK